MAAPSSAAVTIPVDLKQARIGIKPLFKGTDLDEKQTASFEVVVLDGEGKRVAADGLELGAQPPRHAIGSGIAATASGTTRP